MQPAMSFYGELPDSYTMIVNTLSPVIAKIREDAAGKLAAEVEPFDKAIEDRNNSIKALRDGSKDGKLSEENQKEVTRLESEIATQRADKEKAVAAFGATEPLVKQVIDLALLANGLLRGENLSQFINRSVQLL